MTQNNRLTGRIASKGIVEGRACVINSYSDLAKVRAGDIVITAQTDMNYVPFLIGAGGLITETGGRTCHAAIYARENRLPCIVGVTDARTSLSGHSRIRLDGDNNEIVLLTSDETSRENENGDH